MHRSLPAANVARAGAGRVGRLHDDRPRALRGARRPAAASTCRATTRTPTSACSCGSADASNWYMPDAELYHLEGQSYSPGRAPASNRYNMWLHTHLWGEQIAELMESRPHPERLYAVLIWSPETSFRLRRPEPGARFCPSSPGERLRGPASRTARPVATRSGRMTESPARRSDSSEPVGLVRVMVDAHEADRAGDPGTTWNGRHSSLGDVRTLPRVPGPAAFSLPPTARLLLGASAADALDRLPARTLRDT